MYQSKDASGHNEIEIFNYDNNIDKAVSLIPKPAMRQALEGEEAEVVY